MPIKQTTLLTAIALLGLSCILAACSQYGKRSRIPASSPIMGNVDPLYAACMQRCNEQSSLGTLTRKGCLQTCPDLRRKFTFLDKKYATYEACAKDMDTFDLNRDLVIKEYHELCLQKFTHLHQRKGCKDAATVFYEAATTENVCSWTAYAKQQTSSMSSRQPTFAPTAVYPIQQPAEPIHSPLHTKPESTMQAQPAYTPPIQTYQQQTPVDKKQTPSKKTVKKVSSSQTRKKTSKKALVPPVSPAPVLEKDAPMPEEIQSETGASPIQSSSAPAHQTTVMQEMQHQSTVTNILPQTTPVEASAKTPVASAAQPQNMKGSQPALPASGETQKHFLPRITP